MKNFVGFETDPNFFKSQIREENERPNVEQIQFCDLLHINSLLKIDDFVFFSNSIFENMMSYLTELGLLS